MTSTSTQTQPATPEAVGPEPTQTPEQPDTVAQAAQTPSDAAQRFQEAARQGTVHFYRMRANGSTRAVAYLPADSEAREVAEYAAMMVDGGAAVGAVAADMGVSRATVRRLVAAVALAEEIEEDDSLSDLWEEGVEAIFLSVLNGEHDDEDDEQ